MNPTKGAVAHISRIGALAVALGVGAAMATGTGVAVAQPSDTGSAAGGSSPSDTGAAGPAPDPLPGGSTDSAGGPGKPSSTADPGNGMGETTTLPGSSSVTSDRSAGPRVVFGSGRTPGRILAATITDALARAADLDDDGAGADESIDELDAAADALTAATDSQAADDGDAADETPAEADADTPDQPDAAEDGASQLNSPAADEPTAATQAGHAAELGPDMPESDIASGAATRPALVITDLAERTARGSSAIVASRAQAAPVSDRSSRRLDPVAVMQNTLGAATRRTANAPATDALAGPTAGSGPVAAATQTGALPQVTDRAPATGPDEAEEPRLPRLVTQVLAAVGIAPLLANNPVAPGQTPVLWALLAWARREFDRLLNPAASSTRAQPILTTAAAPAAAPAQTDLAAAAVATQPTSLDSTALGWVTGQNNPFPPAQTNNTQMQGIYGTDVGIIWENGLTGNIQIAFGDTFSGPNMTGDWRSNVLLLSNDENLTDGMALIPTGYAFQFIPSAPSALGLLGSEVTIIPTAAISVQDEQYVNYMSVKSWDSPGRWTTNYSAVSMYDQATDRWVLVPSTIRSAGFLRSSTPYVAGSQNFQQAAYVLQPTDQVMPGETRYLYAFGTPSGRQGSAYLSRVAEDDLTDLSKYEYWDGQTWVADKPAVAAPIIGDSPNSTGLFGFIVDWANDPDVFGGYLAGLFGPKTGGNVSEMSVQYNDYLGKYVVTYTDGNNDVQMRTADQPEGPWSDPITLATSAQYPGLYAPMQHPWSGTGKLVDNNNDPDVNNLYWNMSIWGPYNVVLMQTDLTPLKTTQV